MSDSGLKKEGSAKSSASSSRRASGRKGLRASISLTNGASTGHSTSTGHSVDRTWYHHHHAHRGRNLDPPPHHYEPPVIAAAASVPAFGASFANPAPLGLMGFGITTLLLNFYNARVFGLTAKGSLPLIWSLGLFYGGAAQVIAGIFEFIKGNTFGMVAFCSYGFFWISFVTYHFFAVWGLSPAPDPGAECAYLVLWGTFSCCMFVRTFKTTQVLKFVFGTVTLLFYLIALSKGLDMASKQYESKGAEEAAYIIDVIAGVVGIICGGSAFYLAMAEINDWPIFPIKPKAITTLTEVTSS